MDGTGDNNVRKLTRWTQRDRSSIGTQGFSAGTVNDSPSQTWAELYSALLETSTPDEDLTSTPQAQASVTNLGLHWPAYADKTCGGDSTLHRGLPGSKTFNSCSSGVEASTSRHSKSTMACVEPGGQAEHAPLPIFLFPRTDTEDLQTHTWRVATSEGAESNSQWVPRSSWTMVQRQNPMDKATRYATIHFTPVGYWEATIYPKLHLGLAASGSFSTSITRDATPVSQSLRHTMIGAMRLAAKRKSGSRSSWVAQRAYEVASAGRHVIEFAVQERCCDLHSKIRRVGGPAAELHQYVKAANSDEAASFDGVKDCLEGLEKLGASIEAAQGKGPIVIWDHRKETEGIIPIHLTLDLRAPPKGLDGFWDQFKVCRPESKEESATSTLPSISEE